VEFGPKSDGAHDAPHRPITRDDNLQLEPAARTWLGREQVLVAGAGEWKEIVVHDAADVIPEWLAALIAGTFERRHLRQPGRAFGVATAPADARRLGTLLATGLDRGACLVGLLTRARQSGGVSTPSAILREPHIRLA
jgi:hypothetical protein